MPNMKPPGKLSIESDNARSKPPQKKKGKKGGKGGRGKGKRK